MVLSFLLQLCYGDTKYIRLAGESILQAGVPELIDRSGSPEDIALSRIFEEAHKGLFEVNRGRVVVRLPDVFASV